VHDAPIADHASRRQVVFPLAAVEVLGRLRDSSNVDILLS
jgi:hypothetical protein